MDTAPGTPTRRRSVRRRRLRALAGLTVALAIGYAALPFWLPSDWLVRRLVIQLSSDLNRTVHIDTARVGWVEGVVFEGLTIEDRPGSPHPELAKIRRLRCGFRPIKTLLTGQVDRVEIEGTELFLAVDKNGKLNVADLGERELVQLPSLNYAVDALTCHVRTPTANESLSIDHLQCRLEPETGLLRLLGELRPREKTQGAGPSRLTPFSIHARITVPRLKPGVSLGGEVQVNWQGLALTDLPLALMPRVPIEQVDGTTTGQLTFNAKPDLDIDFHLDITLDGVGIRQQQAHRIAHLPDAHVYCTGHWDPNTDVIALSSLSYETPAVQFIGVGDPDDPALIWDRDGEAPFELHVRGVVKDWLGIRSEWPEVDRYMHRAGVTMAGSADFRFGVIRYRSRDHISCVLEAERSACTVIQEANTYLSAKAGLAKRLALDLIVDRQGSGLLDSRLDLTLGGLSLSSKAYVECFAPLPQASLAGVVRYLPAVLPTLRSELFVKCSDLGEILEVLPELTDRLQGSQWRGPMNASVSLKPVDEHNQIEVAIAMEADTELRIEDLFAKPAGEPLLMSLGLYLPNRPAEGYIGPLRMQVDYGSAKLAIDEQRASLNYRLASADDSHGLEDLFSGAEASWFIPMHIERIEDFCALSPKWQTWFLQNADRKCSGNVQMTFRGFYSDRPDAWLARVACDLVGDELALQWSKYLDKPAGSPISLSVTYSNDVSEEDQAHCLSITLKRPTGSVTGSARVKSLDNAGVGEHVQLDAQIADVNDWLMLSPWLSQRAIDYQPSGPLTLTLNYVADGTHQVGSTSLDATDAGFVVPAKTAWTKRPGVASAIGLKWQSDLANGTSDERHWRVDDGQVFLAGLKLESIHGSLESGQTSSIADVPHPQADTVEALLQSIAIPVFQSADLSAKGTLSFDSSIEGLHPQLRALCEQFSLAGSAAGAFSLRADSDAFRLNGSVNAESISLSAPTGHPAAPSVSKLKGADASLAFDVALKDRGEGQLHHVSVDEFALDLKGNCVSVTGDLRLPISSELAPTAFHADLVTAIKLDHADRLLSLLPGSKIDRLKGRCDARAGLICARDGWNVKRADLNFDDFQISVSGQPITLDGDILFSPKIIKGGQLRWACGESGGTIAATVRREDDSHGGWVGLTLDHLDVIDLGQRFNRLLAELDLAKEATSDKETRSFARRVIRALQRAEVTVDSSADTLALPLPPDHTLLADAASARILIQKGPVTVQFRGLVDGGVVTGEFVSHTQVARPTGRLTYTAEDIQPGPLVDGYLIQMFPGLRATGPVTLIDESYQKLLPEPGDPNYEVGQGELIIEGGTIEGRAAPVWVTRIFPGLNLAKFTFSYMHQWFDKRPSGRTYHQMIFQGQYYNIYMIGYADRNRRFRYEVGVDLLADFDSRYWADSGQGRIPLFIKTGKIAEDGSLLEERVNYMSPQRVLDTLFIRNNPVVTVYHAVRKRVLGEK